MFAYYTTFPGRACSAGSMRLYCVLIVFALVTRFLALPRACCQLTGFPRLSPVTHSRVFPRAVLNAAYFPFPLPLPPHNLPMRLWKEGRTRNDENKEKVAAGASSLYFLFSSRRTQRALHNTLYPNIPRRLLFPRAHNRNCSRTCRTR